MCYSKFLKVDGIKSQKSAWATHLYSIKIKRPYMLQAYSSGYTLSRHTQLKQNSRTLPGHLAVCQPFQLKNDSTSSRRDSGDTLLA